MGRFVVAVALVVTLASCGRIGFEPLSPPADRDGGADATTDAADSATDAGQLNLIALNGDGPAHGVAWIRHLQGTGDLIVRDVALDPAGTLIVGGSFTGNADFGLGPTSAVGDEDGFVLRLDEDGNTLAARSYGGTGTDFEVNAVAADARGVVIGGQLDGSVQVGTSTLNSNAKDVVVAELSSDLATVAWARQYGGVGDQDLDAIALRAGKVILGGRYVGDISLANLARSSVAEGAYAAQLDASGDPEWAAAGESSDVHDVGDVSVDASGTVHIIGTTRGAMDFGAGPLPDNEGRDAFLASFTPSGALQWARQLGGPFDDSSASLLEDGNDILSFTDGRPPQDYGLGPISPDAGGASMVILGAFDTAGNAVRSDDYGERWTESAWDMDRLSSGGIVTAGTFFSLMAAGSLVANAAAGGGYDWFILTFDSNKQPSWIATFGTPENENSKPAFIAAGPNDSIYVAVSFAADLLVGDQTVTASSVGNFVVMKLVPSGP